MAVASFGSKFLNDSVISPTLIPNCASPSVVESKLPVIATVLNCSAKSGPKI